MKQKKQKKEKMKQSLVTNNLKHASDTLDSSKRHSHSRIPKFKREN